MTYGALMTGRLYRMFSAFGAVNSRSGRFGSNSPLRLSSSFSRVMRVLVSSKRSRSAIISSIVGSWTPSAAMFKILGVIGGAGLGGFLFGFRM